MDPFIEAFERARGRLIAKEGQAISVREVLRRAKISDSERPGASYHLNPHRHTGAKPHTVPPSLVTRLHSVLREVITLAELEDAARRAAGYQRIEERPTRGDFTYQVQMFYGDEEVTPEERERVTSRLLSIVAEGMARHGATK